MSGTHGDPTQDCQVGRRAWGEAGIRKEIGYQRFLFNRISIYSALSVQNTVLGSLAGILMKNISNLSSCGLQARDGLGININ